MTAVRLPTVQGLFLASEGTTMSRIRVRCVGYAFATLLTSQVAAPQFVAPAARAAEPAPVQALTAAYNASAHDLFAAFVATPGNIVFSPYSIGTAMAMVLSGARGETAREMTTVLRQTLARDAIDAANASVLATLNGYDRSAEPVTCPGRTMRFNGKECEAPLPANGVCPAGYQESKRCIAPGRRPPSAALRAANALMLLERKGDMISSGYAGGLEQNYRAQVFRGAGLDEINRWVSRQTEGKIEKILDVIDPDAPAVILNAVYFKAAWRSPFIARATSDEDFRLTASTKVKVATMHRLGSYEVAAGRGFRAIRLPYSVDALAMVVVIPDEVGGTDKLARELDAPALAALLRSLTETKTVELALPRFKTSFKAGLGELFRRAGMKRAFDLNLADFSGMTARPASEAQLAISEIVHRAVIDVTEEGTEAAAATAITMMTSSMPAHVEPFVVDRPFLFYIADQATGAILFQGRISDPRAK
jgi:serpin B